MVILFEGFIYNILSNKSLAFASGKGTLLEAGYGVFAGSFSINDNAFELVTKVFNSLSEGLPNISNISLII